MWDSGLRPTPTDVLDKARVAAAEVVRDREHLTLPVLAVQLNVHLRTIQAAARSGRLDVRYSERSIFGRPLRLSTLAAGRAFLRTHYKRYSGQPPGRFEVPGHAPLDFGIHLRELRRRLKISQGDLAELIGAANKAVVYQWESGKRTPSPVFWQRVDTDAGEIITVAKVPVKSNDCARSSVG